MESHDDGHLRVTLDKESTSNKILSGLTCTRRLGKLLSFSAEIVKDAIEKALLKHEVEVDDEWLKIPLSAFQPLEERSPFRFWKKKRSQPEEEPEITIEPEITE